MKGEIYNFILHSDIGTGTSVASKTYFIDWNRIPDSRYKLTFSFTSSTLTIATAFDAMLYINELGCCNNTTCMGQFGSLSLNPGFIGIIRNYTATTYLETNIIDNPPSYLRARPRDNQIIVNINQNLASQIGTRSSLLLRWWATP